jgi:hypothetical protein
MSKEQRYRICGDNSGHEYFIKVEDVDAFYQWVESTEDEEIALEYEGPDFEENRIDGRFTFTDPKNE